MLLNIIIENISSIDIAAFSEYILKLLFIINTSYKDHDLQRNYDENIHTSTENISNNKILKL